MDNEFAQLEDELRRLRPRGPSAELRSRLEATLDGPLAAASGAGPAPTRHLGAAFAAPRPRSRYTSATSWTSWKWANWTVAAALAGVMAVWSLQEPIAASSRISGVGTPAAPAAELIPVKGGRVLLASRADGVVQLDDGSAVERVRDFYVDSIEWRDPAGRAHLRWDVPRESVRYVALAAY